ncbi:MAG: hypothetical protein JEZ12_03055 [Desulfobacterium sp.]|nr:hypothetical protein [Desulfobacterium sp.]
METNVQPDKSAIDKWIYIVVQNPGTGGEQFMGFKAPDSGEEFIPAFTSKEEAQQCFLIMPKDMMANKYEIQAILKDDLVTTAKGNGFEVYLMDHKSCIKGKL